MLLIESFIYESNFKADWVLHEKWKIATLCQKLLKTILEQKPGLKLSYKLSYITTYSTTNSKRGQQTFYIPNLNKFANFAVFNCSSPGSWRRSTF